MGIIEDSLSLCNMLHISMPQFPYRKVEINAAQVHFVGPLKHVANLVY